MQPRSYLIEAPLLEIISPEEGADYDVSDGNYTTTPPIPFRAKVVPEQLSQWLSDISWTLDLEYDTTISRGPWDSQKTFQTQHDTIHHETYSSEGGEVEVNAEASLDGVTLTANQVFTVTGVSIPDEVITARLINLYNGATPNLLTGIAMVESGCYCQFYEITKYDVTDRWPRESEEDGGSHIGLMQVPVTMEDAWNWLTNTQTAANIITGNIQQSHNYVNNIRQEHPDLRRDLTDVEHENNALSIYRIGRYYYVPNADFTDWIANSDNSIGVNYANQIRQNLQ